MTDAPCTVNSIVLTGVLVHHGGMKPFASFLVLGLTLAACAPLTIYHRTGVAVTRMQSDLLDCEIAALRDAPVASEIRQRPPVFVRGRKICRDSVCQFEPGYWLDGDIYTVDVNADLRKRSEGRCMARQGYQPVQVQLCRASVKASVVPQQTRVLPELSENACAIRYEAGVWQIVNPGVAGQ